jgi:cytochrome c
MDGFELNKIAGAVLTAMLVIASGKTVLDIAFQKHAPAKAGWVLPVSATGSAAAKSEPAAPFDVKTVLASLPKASPDNGRDVFKKCLACHTPVKGGPNLVGPNLYGIVGRKVAQAPGFEARYSDAMKAHGGEWSWEQLAKYLHNPAAAIPGNKMVFAGLPDNADLADLLAFIRTLADSPPPLPQ